MTKSIGAKCFRCGHITRVPAQFGGRRMDCPGCAEVVVIPHPSDSGKPILSDDQLPMVAGDIDLFEESEYQPIEEMEDIEDVPESELGEGEEIVLHPVRPGEAPAVVTVPRSQGRRTRRVPRLGRGSRSTEFRKPKSVLPFIISVIAIAFFVAIVVIVISAR